MVVVTAAAAVLVVVEVEELHLVDHLPLITD